MPDFEVIVVGAGPAGSAAALSLARLGHSVCLLERGPFAGSKNVYGGVIYGRILDDLIPQWWERAPVQRWVTRRGTMLLTEHQSLCIDYRTTTWNKAPYNGATAYRPDFDKWLADEAVAAGATLITSTTATGLVRTQRGVVGGVLLTRGFLDREHASLARQKAQGDLARRCVMRVGDGLQRLPRLAAR